MIPDDCLSLEILGPSHKEALLKATHESQDFQKSWGRSLLTSEEFDDYYERSLLENVKSYVMVNRETRSILALANLNEIIRGVFQNAFLGYMVMKEARAQGVMKKTVKKVLEEAFGPLELHRIEAGIQPHNAPSIGVVKSLGFRYEGLSKRYLKIGGVWCDHERWAMTVEDFETLYKN